MINLDLHLKREYVTPQCFLRKERRPFIETLIWLQSHVMPVIAFTLFFLDFGFDIFLVLVFLCSTFKLLLVIFPLNNRYDPTERLEPAALQTTESDDICLFVRKPDRHIKVELAAVPPLAVRCSLKDVVPKNAVCKTLYYFRTFFVLKICIKDLKKLHYIIYSDLNSIINRRNLDHSTGFFFLSITSGKTMGCVSFTEKEIKSFQQSVFTSTQVRDESHCLYSRHIVLLKSNYRIYIPQLFVNFMQVVIFKNHPKKKQLPKFQENVFCGCSLLLTTATC